MRTILELSFLACVISLLPGLAFGQQDQSTHGDSQAESYRFTPFEAGFQTKPIWEYPEFELDEVPDPPKDPVDPEQPTDPYNPEPPFNPCGMMASCGPGVGLEGGIEGDYELLLEGYQVEERLDPDKSPEY